MDVTISRKTAEQAVQALILARTIFEELSGKPFNAIDPDVTYPIADAWAELHAVLDSDQSDTATPAQRGSDEVRGE